MFGLKKIFNSSQKPAPAQATTSPAPAAERTSTAFLCSEAVFDRRNRLAGRLFRLHQSSFAADAPTRRQRQFDQILLDTLHTSRDAWTNGQVFIPLCSVSLNHPTVDQLEGKKICLLIQLAPESEANTLYPQLEALRERGLSIGIYRQPRHPAFGEVIALADCGALDIGQCEAESVRDFSAAFRAIERPAPASLFAANIDSLDEHRLCHQWRFDYFHGRFSEATEKPGEEAGADPHKLQLLQLLRLVQSDSETADIARAMKQDPLLAFRILRYLNSPALGLSCHIESLEQALLILGRQRLFRWLAVLLFSVREPQFGDWLLVESALIRGRMMESLGTEKFPGEAGDALFLTGIFSCLDRLLRRPLPEILGEIPLPDIVRQALLEQRGPYAPLLAIAAASDNFDLQHLENVARQAQMSPDSVNRAFLCATAWASEVTQHWE